MPYATRNPQIQGESRSIPAIQVHPNCNFIVLRRQRLPRRRVRPIHSVLRCRPAPLTRSFAAIDYEAPESVNRASLFAGVPMKIGHELSIHPW